MAVRAHVGDLPRAALSRWGVLFMLAGLAGLALRVWVYRAALGIPDSDEAVMGLMVRHARHGELSTFFWGQPYGGTQEVLLTVPVFLLAGTQPARPAHRPDRALRRGRIPRLAGWVAHDRGARRRCRRRAVLDLAPSTLFLVTRQQGFYASNLVYGSPLLLLALRAVERPDRMRSGLFGLVLGLAFWQTAQIVPIAIPAIGWMVWKQPRCLR